MNKNLSTIPDSSIVLTGHAKYLLFNIDDIVTNEVRNSGYWEKETIDKSVPILKNFSDGIVLDIGANLGSYSVSLALEFPQLEFHAFEPQRVIFYQLCANIVINKLENIYPHDHGLSSEDKKLLIAMPEYCTDKNIGGFSLDSDVRNAEDGLLLTAGKIEEVELKTLDSFDYKNVRLIKIDVEGSELEVLKGATKTIIKNCYPPIIFEAWTLKPWFLPRRRELFSFIESLGYVIDSFLENSIAYHKSNTCFEAKMKYSIISISDKRAENVSKIKQIMLEHDLVNNIEFFDATKKDSFHVLESYGIRTEVYSPDDGRLSSMTNTEGGCWISHYRCIDYAKDNGHLLVFEDDALLSPNFSNHLERAIKDLPDDWDFLSLYTESGQNFLSEESDIGSDCIHKCISQLSGNVAMLYSSNGAKKITDLFYRNGATYNVDSVIYRASRDGVISGYIVRPDVEQLVLHGIYDSIIDPENIRNT